MEAKRPGQTSQTLLVVGLSREPRLNTGLIASGWTFTRVSLFCSISCRAISEGVRVASTGSSGRILVEKVILRNGLENVHGFPVVGFEHKFSTLGCQGLYLRGLRGFGD